LIRPLLQTLLLGCHCQRRMSTLPHNGKTPLHTDKTSGSSSSSSSNMLCRAPPTTQTIHRLCSVFTARDLWSWQKSAHCGLLVTVHVTHLLHLCRRIPHIHLAGMLIVQVPTSETATTTAARSLSSWQGTVNHATTTLARDLKATVLAATTCLSVCP